jgi:hypothetical protein
MTGVCSKYAAGARRCRRTLALAVMFLLAAGGVLGWTVAAGFAQEGQDPRQQAESRERAAQAKRIVGVWDVAVTLRDCQTGSPVGAVRARNMLIAGGTLTELNARGNPSLRTPSFGTWHVDEKGTYSAVFRYSRFDAAGTFIQTSKVTRRIRLSPDANAFDASAFVEVFDVNDNLVQTGCATEAATRLE